MSDELYAGKCDATPELLTATRALVATIELMLESLGAWPDCTSGIAGREALAIAHAAIAKATSGGNNARPND